MVSLKPSSWTSIDWKSVEKSVYKLQTRIYKSMISGDYKSVRKLQRTLIKSWHGRLKAVKTVTSDNRGKRTAGVDGKSRLKPEAKLKLAENLKLDGNSKPVKRIWIPKPGKDEKRPLGIPTIEDRAKQALLKLALEPEWEAKFEPHSYGFRPGKNTHDAAYYILNKARRCKNLWILDADIKGCFDNINHEALLEKVGQPPKVTKQIKAWLKSGVIDFKVKDRGYTATEYGVPQGGIISPLLSNIALHGLEVSIKEWLPTVYREKEYSPKTNSWRKASPKNTKKTLSIVRYADDFVVLHQNKEVIELVKTKIEEFLDKVGLKINQDKTRIVNIHEGFDFLGFNFRRYSKVGNYRSDINTKGKRIKGRLLVKPCKKSIKTHYKKIAKIIEIYNARSQKELIERINPIIRGWANYYRYVVSKETFSKLDNLIWKRLWRWASRRHDNQKRKRTARTYFPNVDNRRASKKWEFFTIDKGRKYSLVEHVKIGIRKYNIVNGNKSPYDGDLGYWSNRRKQNPLISQKESKLLKIQNGRCNICHQTFLYGQPRHIDHIVPRNRGGNNVIENLQLIHNHCHTIKSCQNSEYRGNNR